MIATGNAAFGSYRMHLEKVQKSTGMTQVSVHELLKE